MGSDTTITAHDSTLLEREPRVRRLTCVFPKDAREQWTLDDRRVVLGREPGRSGIVVDDREASRRHVDLAYVAEFDVYRIKDRDSKNGTYLQGQKLEGAQYLRPGAVFRLGGSLFVYAELDDADDEPLDAPPQVSLARAKAERLIARAAKSTLPVLIVGPTGAGKELLAKLLHKESGREGQLIAVNCATFSRDLIGSELFGHVQGAFSGANSDRSGLFVSARDGTLFLDEIAELPSEQQPTLLRALQEGRVRPVGSDHEVDVDARVVAATHRDLETLEQDGRFRMDLLARLSGVTISMPGLSERREEILPLFEAFLSAPDKKLSVAAAEALLLYAWPRNVRELKHVAEGVGLMHPDIETIEVRHLPQNIRPQTRAAEQSSDRPTKERIEEALAGSSGNVARAARALGCQRQALYRWMNAYGLDPANFRGDP